MARIEETLARGESCALAALGDVLPASLIKEALEAEAVEARRRRKLPPDLVTWLVVGMALFRSLAIESVLRRVIDGVVGLVRFGTAELPCATSIAHARDRLGWKPVRALFQKLVATVLPKHATATTWRGLQVYTLDGMCARMPDTLKNDECFGRPGASRGEKSGFPQLRSVLLVTAWTHFVARAVVGRYHVSELTLAAELLPLIPPAALLLMDRAYYSFCWLVSLVQRDLSFVARAKTGGRTLRVKKLKQLGPGDWLAMLVAPPYLMRKSPDLPSTLTVRAIWATRRGFRARLLVTNLLDSERFPVGEIAALYDDRWEAELTNREIKIYQARTPITFRSFTPDRVFQEFFGLLIAYNCVRALMADAADTAGVPPLRLSFTDCLERIRASLPSIALASGEARALLRERLLDELASCLLPPRRRGRRCERVVKIKMSNYRRKKPKKGGRGRGGVVRGTAPMIAV